MKPLTMPGDEIEVVDEKCSEYGRVRIREQQGGLTAVKTSVFLTPDELDQHAQECTDLAAKLRARAAPTGPGPNQVIVAFCNKCGRWTMQCMPTSQNRRVWTRIAQEAGDRIEYIDADELANILRGACDGDCEEKPKSYDDYAPVACNEFLCLPERNPSHYVDGKHLPIQGKP